MKESLPILTHERNMIFIRQEIIQAERKGITVFDTAIFIRVEVPGDKMSTMDYKAKVIYSEDAPHIHGKSWKNEQIWPRFGKYIDEWEANHGAVAVSGTPIETWAAISASQAALLKHNGIHVVESLPNLTDAQIPALGMNGRKLIEQAKDWLAARADSAHTMKLSEEKRVLEERLRGLEERLDEQSEFMAALNATLTPDQIEQAKGEVVKRRGPGRPRKEPLAA